MDRKLWNSTRAIIRGYAIHSALLLLCRHGGGGLPRDRGFAGFVLGLMAVTELVRTGSVLATIMLCGTVLFVMARHYDGRMGVAWAMSIVAADVIVAPVILLGAPHWVPLPWAMVSTFSAMGRISRSGK
jgi:hypothetical protein